MVKTLAFSANLLYDGHIMKRKSFESELNQAKTPMLEFIEAYNKTLPASFPRATPEALEQFRQTHTILFKGRAGWSVDKHRKRVMDWLSSYQTQVHES
jgi:hypothetical protein